ncbi:protein cornichon homolog 4 isoform X1 [Phyllostomus discolor]|uniref:Protein cornichon homolog 4 isoform X1 n=2 Tax=Boreoeutheria TaxID=1437010 RepID=A0A7E6CYS6_9CHIR|nr:protein cornichon homolog 4 isoform X1 [Phyllostomus discolor]
MPRSGGVDYTPQKRGARAYQGHGEARRGGQGHPSRFDGRSGGGGGWRRSCSSSRSSTAARSSSSRCTSYPCGSGRGPPSGPPPGAGAEVGPGWRPGQWVIPELIGHSAVTMLMLVSLHWFIFLLNLPVATWNIYRFIMVPSGNMGVFDPTEIHNRGQLKSHMKEAMIKLGFHLLCFFMYLYSMILALIND